MAQFIRVARSAGIVALFIGMAAAGTLSGVLFAYADDLPQISALDGYAPSTITRVYASGGELIGEFATERRLVIGYDGIAPHLRQAIISAEDGDFDQHFGLSISRLAVTAGRDIFDVLRDRLSGRQSRPAGASTITQQLARNLFPEDVGFSVTVERKIREAMVALQIEKRYTKREIFTFYANHIHFGHGTYGVESAARLYFDKPAKDVSLDEAALIAGIIQAPARQSPFVNMDAAKARRDYALRRMLSEGYITEDEAAAAMARPIVAYDRRQQRSAAPYFVEEIRKHLEQAYGAKALYESGLSVMTTLDVTLQESANRAIDAGLRRLGKRRGYRAPTENILSENGSQADFHHERWARPIAAGDIVPAVVETLDSPAPTAGAIVRLGPFRASLTPEGFSWTRRSNANQLFKVGDLIEVGVTSVDDEAGTAEVTLDQTPLVEGALIAIENRTGHIKAMVGGWNFNRSKFNRAVQALRQMGSTFKPIVFTTAVDRGFTPASTIIDEPVVYPLLNDEEYEPQNYDHEFEGEITLRRALEQSRNIPAIRLMETVGPESVLGYAKRFGFSQDFGPYLSIALGAGDANLQELTSAYSVFPNQGVRMKPLNLLRVIDRDGNLLEENRPEAFDVVRADTAFVMTSLLRGVVQRGTGVRAASLDWPLGGKTGTVDDNTDAWFVGFDPNITVGVWTGLDEKKSIGPSETGAAAALPIWMDFMRDYIDAYGDREHPPEFGVPSNIVFLDIDRATGTLITEETQQRITETFIAGTQPGDLFGIPEPVASPPVLPELPR